MATITESITRRTDPSIWKPPQFDREERWVLPSIVGNVLKEVSETSNVVVGNSTLPLASFMSGRVVFSGAATGTKSLPTATDIITYLEANYSQLTGRVVAATGVTPKVKEIEVEFFNNTAAQIITLAQNTGITLTPNNLQIPVGSSAKIKFIIEQTTPVPTITAVLATGVAGSATTINPTSILTTTPHQILSRDTTTGQLYNTDYANVTSAVAWGTDLQLDPATGWIEKKIVPRTNIFMRETNQGPIAVSGPAGGGYAEPTATLGTIIVFPTQYLVNYGITHAAGTFTTPTNERSYMVNVQVTLTAAAPASWISVHTGTDPTVNEVARSGMFDTATQTIDMPFAFGATTFIVVLVNNEGGAITVLGQAIGAAVQYGALVTSVHTMMI